jgi:hypothetical protein
VIALARALVRLLAFLLLALLALAGLAAAVFSIQSGTAALSYANGLSLVGGPDARDTVGSFLDGVEGGSNGLLVALSGAAAVLLGLLLLAGLLAPSRERVVTLARTEGFGRLAARPRPLAQAATALAEQVHGVTAARASVRPGRRAGGTLSVRADHPRPVDDDEVRRGIEDRLRPLTEPFGLRARVQTRVGERGSRVQ